jgi:acyl carrier protein
MHVAHAREDVRRFLRAMLVEIAKLPEAEIREEATLDCGLRMESVALVEIQTAVEEEFDIEIDVLEVIELNRLDLIVDYIYKCVRARADEGAS